MMYCKECGSETNMMLQLTVVIPSKHKSKLTKKIMASKEFKVWGANWDDADYICPKCGYTSTGKE